MPVAVQGTVSITIEGSAEVQGFPLQVIVTVSFEISSFTPQHSINTNQTIPDLFIPPLIDYNFNLLDHAPNTFIQDTNCDITEMCDVHFVITSQPLSINEAIFAASRPFVAEFYNILQIFGEICMFEKL